MLKANGSFLKDWDYFVCSELNRLQKQEEEALLLDAKFSLEEALKYNEKHHHLDDNWNYMPIFLKNHQGYKPPTFSECDAVLWENAEFSGKFYEGRYVNVLLTLGNKLFHLGSDDEDEKFYVLHDCGSAIIIPSFEEISKGDKTAREIYSECMALSLRICNETREALETILENKADYIAEKYGWSNVHRLDSDEIEKIQKEEMRKENRKNFRNASKTKKAQKRAIVRSRKSLKECA